jgi:hypothetical protein
VVLQEGAPGLRRRLLPPRHVLGNSGLGDGDAELEQLAVDSRRAPAGVLRGNATDERPQVGLGRGASGRARSPAPEEAEAEAVPADDGGGPHDGERVTPTRPELRDPEGAVEEGKLRPGPPPDEDRELLAQGRFSRTRLARGQNTARTAAARAHSRAGIPTSVAERTGGNKVRLTGRETVRRCGDAPNASGAGGADGLFGRHNCDLGWRRSPHFERRRPAGVEAASISRSSVSCSSRPPR